MILGWAVNAYHNSQSNTIHEKTLMVAVLPLQVAHGIRRRSEPDLHRNCGSAFLLGTVRSGIIGRKRSGSTGNRFERDHFALIDVSERKMVTKGPFWTDL